MNLANFRDLGGLVTKSGKVIQAHRLLRSGEVVSIDEASQKLLSEHQLTKIIDLRSAEELSMRPDDELVAVDYQWIDVMKSVKDDSSMKNLMNQSDLSVVDRHMKQIYYNLVMNEGCQEGYREYFNQLLATPEGSVLFHCFAGKDRTGMAGVFTLEALEVNTSAIYKDYLATNEQRKIPNEMFLAHLKAQEELSKEQLASVKVALEVSPSYLDYAYELIEKHYGSMDCYLEKVLGLTVNKRVELQAMYLE